MPIEPVKPLMLPFAVLQLCQRSPHQGCLCRTVLMDCLAIAVALGAVSALLLAMLSPDAAMMESDGAVMDPAKPLLVRSPQVALPTTVRVFLRRRPVSRQRTPDRARRFSLG